MRVYRQISKAYSDRWDRGDKTGNIGFEFGCRDQ